MNKTFSNHNRSWYAKAVPLKGGVADELMIHLIEDNASTDVLIRWYHSDGGKSPRLEADASAWSLLAESGLLQVLALIGEVDPDTMTQALIAQGYIDTTQVNQPASA